MSGGLETFHEAKAGPYGAIEASGRCGVRRSRAPSYTVSASRPPRRKVMTGSMEGRQLLRSRRSAGLAVEDLDSRDFYQATNAGSDDAFVSKLSAAGTSLPYSSYLGGIGGD